MAVSPKKTSKSKRNMRRSHHALKANQVAKCPKCGAPKLPHRVCLECGQYGERQVLENTVEA